MSDSNQIDTKINFTGKTFKKYFSNTCWLFAEKVLRLAINLAVGVYVVRYLGSVNNGMLAYALSVVGILAAFSTMGLGGVVVRELLKDEENRDSILGTSFCLKLFSSILLFAFVLIYYLIENDLQNLLLLIISASIIFRSFDIIESYFQSKVLSKYPVHVKFISVLLADFGKVVLILYRAPLIYFGVVAFAEIFLLAIGYVSIFKNHGLNIFQWKFKTDTAKSLLKDSWPLLFSSVAVTIYMRVDKILLKVMMGDAAVGIYDAAVRLCEGWYFIPVVISSSLFPAIVNAKKKSEKLYHSRLQKLYDLMAWLSILIAIPITIFSSHIINFLYGTEFISAASVLTIYIWAGVPVFLGTASGRYLLTENYTKISFARTLTGMIINIGLNIILIPIYGIKGAAIATLISYTAATFFILFIPKTRKQIGMMIKSIFFINLFHIKFKR